MKRDITVELPFIKVGGLLIKLSGLRFVITREVEHVGSRDPDFCIDFNVDGSEGRALFRTRDERDKTFDDIVAVIRKKVEEE